MREAIHGATKQSMTNYVGQLMHPIGGPLRILFGLDFEFGQFSANLHENVRTMEEVIMKHV